MNPLTYKKNKVLYYIKKTYPAIIAVLTLCLSSGCASMEKSILLGASSLGAIGVGVGSAAGQNVGSALLGLGIGAVVGGTMGYLSYSEDEKKRELLKASNKGKDFGKNLPLLKAPEASCTRVGERIEADRFIGAHILCTIEKPAVWSK